MRIGNRDQRILFREALTTQSESGEVSSVERVTLYSCWAAVRPTSGNERIAAQQINAIADQVFNVRDPHPIFDITPDEKVELVHVSDGGKVYDITRVDAAGGGRRRELDITARTKAAA